MPRQHRVEDGAQRVHVGPRVHLFALDLLGRHIPRRAHDGVRARVLPDLRRLAVVNEPEVEHLDEVVVVILLQQKNVARLDVSVHDAQGVRFPERAANLLGDVDGALRHEAARLQLFGERTSLEILHRDEAAVRGLAVIEDRDDMGMRQLRGHARFEQEPPDEVCCVAAPGESGIEHLDRAAALEPRLLAEVDLAHSAARDGPQDVHPIQQGLADERVRRVARSARASRRFVGHRRRCRADRPGRVGRQILLPRVVEHSL